MTSPNQPSGQLLTDQKALERIFRDHYARLVEDAKKRLGDAASAAPRVVSKSFHLAWQDRKRFHSMEELDAFLGAQIHHGAAREQSRIAGLHRMDHGAKKDKHQGAEMSVDEAWDRLEHTLQGGAPEAYRQRASTARHEAAEHVAQLGKERNMKPLLFTVGGIIVAAVIGVFFVQKAGESRAIDRALNAGDVRNTETGAGQQADITLDDGTVVRLGPESKLTVPKRFGMSGGYRAVKIEGTASFNVTRAGDKPFDVRSGLVSVTAAGTQFTVRRYRDDSVFVVHVKDGAIDVKVGDDTRNVTKGNGFAVTNGGALRVPTADELSEASTWTDGTLTISGHTLRYVLPQLKRWYGVDIHVPDAELMNRPVFVTAALNSPREAITSIEKSGGLKFTYIGDNMAFQDTVAGKAKPASKTSTKTKDATKKK